MSSSEENFRVLVIYGVSVAALLLFLHGFFPLQQSIITPENEPELGASFHDDQVLGEQSNRLIHKLVLVIIDALRFDFVKPQTGPSYMPFVSSVLQKNQACLVTTKAQAPTVTMPRLKAITSGTVPTFIDVILNFGASDFNQDNIIKQAVFNGLRIVFYGDDTWLKLFPNAFVRSEGTNSFFASDFTEVDENVTRNVGIELQRSDWDIMILHYLGLDHIGHMEGPTSPLVNPKMREMDSVVEDLANYLNTLEREQFMKTMLIVTGDHGMKDSGSHGGVTYSEITVPLVSIGRPCYVLPGWPDNSKHTPLQIDIAPTISVLMGLKLPNANVGKLIPSLLAGMEKETIMKTLRQNKKSLVHLVPNLCPATQFMETDMILEDWLQSKEKDEKISQLITEKYFVELSYLSETMVKVSTEFSLFSISVGCFILWFCLILLLFYENSKIPQITKVIHGVLMFGTVLHIVSFASSSFIEEEHQTWYFLWPTYCCLAFLETMKNKGSLQKNIKHSMTWIILCGIHRILRKLNQTGDKWAHIPDLKDYLTSSDGQLSTTVLFVIALGTLLWCCHSSGCSPWQVITYGATLLVIISYRISVGSIHLMFRDFYPSSRGSQEATLFWTLLSVFTVQSIWNRTSSSLPWSLVAAFLLRPHNVILVPLEIITSRQIHLLFNRNEDSFWNSLAHTWLGYLYYFYQGNGNSIANIDVASGFTGLEKYNSAYTGVLMAAHTFSGHILSIFLSPQSNVSIAMFRLSHMAFYCFLLIFQLQHLFIWSVFSPKLLYEASFTFIDLMLLLLLYLKNTAIKF